VRGWVTPGALVVIAAVCGIGAVSYQPSAASSGPAGSTLSTPVLSARRLPAALAAMVADERLGQRLNAALVDPTSGIPAAAACMQVQVGGFTIYAHAPSVALLPASNLKLLTGWAAVAKLGASSTLTTSVVAARAPVSGVVDGPLWLVGGGDPLLTTAGFRPSQHEWTWSTEPASHMEALADRIKASGVTAVRGGIIGDDTRYDSQRSIPTWKPSYLSDGEIGAVGALIVDGGFASITHHAPAPSPATAAAAALTTLLRVRGVRVDGAPGRGPAPPGAAAIASLTSLPLGQIVSIMLRESDNLSAEMLVKELGFRFGGGGTWAAGLTVEQQALQASGLPLAGLVLVDGSGLDRGDRSTCDLLVRTVGSGGPVDAGLPIAARDGTLVNRMLGQPEAGKLRAKTGSLSGVAALTGFFPPTAGGSPAFALLVNGLASDAQGRAVEDRLAAILASYPEAPATAALGPS